MQVSHQTFSLVRCILTHHIHVYIYTNLHEKERVQLVRGTIVILMLTLTKCTLSFPC